MNMKYIKYAIAACALAGGIVLLLIGCASKPPTAVESHFFDVRTNPPVVTVLTNVIPFTIYQTNYVRITNQMNVVEVYTNVIHIPWYQTNIIRLTNEAESYTFTPGAGAQRVQEVGGTIGSLFGVGGLVTTGLGALFALWAQIRSKKRYLTSANLAQSIEAVRAFLKQMPNGAQYDSAFVKWLQDHQREGNVIVEVAQLLEAEVSSADAKEAAATIQKIIDALKIQT